MQPDTSFSDLAYAEEMHLEDDELAAFVGAVTRLLGPQLAGVSARDWLDESELMDSPPRATSRDWRAVTVAASARLASHVDFAGQHRIVVMTSLDAKVSLTPQPSCLPVAGLAFDDKLAG